MLNYAIVLVSAKEPAGVISAETEGRLGQVVGAEGEELGLLGNRIGAQASPRQLDHGADQVGHLDAGGSHLSPRGVVDEAL